MTRNKYTVDRVAFPDVKRFGELFELVSKRKEVVVPVTFTGRDVMGDGTVHQVPVGPYCAVRGLKGFDALYVRPSARVLEYLEKTWIGDPRRDQVFFEVVIRDDGTALVTCHNNLILTSRWLALVPASTVKAPK